MLYFKLVFPFFFCLALLFVHTCFDHRVGVGSADFSKMDVLDADDTPLCYQGRYMERDIVQVSFVSSVV